MRFLFECVGCYMLTQPTPSETSSSPAATKSEETKSLVAPAISRRRKRSSSKGHTPDWRPSLFVISEDNAANTASLAPTTVASRETVIPVAAAQRSLKRCGNSSSSGRVNTARAHAREFRQDPFPIVVPAFSAAPFMF